MKPLTILSVCAFLFSCSTPTELLEEGNMEKAFAMASKKLKSGKNVDTNRKVLIEASNQIIKNEL